MFQALTISSGLGQTLPDKDFTTACVCSGGLFSSVPAELINVNSYDAHGQCHQSDMCSSAEYLRVTACCSLPCDLRHLLMAAKLCY